MIFYNPDTQVLGMVTGMGTAKSATATMALGLDPRFDLSKSYWLIAVSLELTRRMHR